MTDKVLKEGRFAFDFSHSIDAFVADKPQYNGLSAVDFIVETEELHLFIEVKDPGNPNAHAPEVFIEKFIDELKTPAKVTGKFKDSLLKQLAQGRVFCHKPIVYVVVLEWHKFDKQQWQRTYDNIKNTMPSFKEDCFSSIKSIMFMMLDVGKFQKTFPMFKVTDITTQ